MKTYKNTHAIMGFILLSLLSIHSICLAQEQNFTAIADKNKILIGEQIHVTLKATLPQESNYQWPIIPDTLTGIEVLSLSNIDSLKENGQWVLQQNLTISAFDSGFFNLPSLQFINHNDTLHSESIAIHVDFPPQVEGVELYDIKQALYVAFDWKNLWIGFAIGIPVLALLIWLFLRWRGRKKPNENIAPELLLSPEEQAYKALNALEEDKLWQQGKNKMYFSKLIDILRVYTERQMGISAMESTAEEIIEQLQEQNLPQDFFEDLKKTLQLSALVKFAKAQSTASENENALAQVRQLVDITKPSVQPKDDEDAA